MTILADLAEEHAALVAIVRPLSDQQWDIDTPAERWRIRDQIGHLAFFDEQGTIAAAEPDRFRSELDELLKDLPAFGARSEALGKELTGAALLARWNDANAKMCVALGSVAEGVRLPWYGPPMSLRSFVTARLMETWAHGADVVDGLRSASIEASREEGDRIAHICHLGAITRGWSYTVRGREAPAGDVRVELTLPSGT
ncbi:MAG TPA: maleylpyruvate isomerase N-terminal domain-containing protein, partial [Acidimicrobiales bacterium]|nr:maleylpyruvate isomerase N-terminal domain-containing protein [Acidimicrobiales bacterium]